MFKKGEVVQSLDTGNLYRVESTLGHVVTVTDGCLTFPVRFDRLQPVIGNNYQAKPKCSR